MREASPENVRADVNRVVPYAHVRDVGASLGFYALLGFAAQSSQRSPDGRLVWALAKSGAGEIMLACSSGEIDAGQQAMLFYMYSPDVAALRARLIAGGVGDGSATGVAAGAGRGVAFPISHPFYMERGELRVHDPDGYVILVGQLA